MMRIRIFALVVAGVVLAAGPSAAAGVHAGLKGGWNKADLRVDEGEFEDSRNGLALGGYVEIPVAPMFSIQPEVLYMMTGDEQDFTNEPFDPGDGNVITIDGTVGVETSYLAFPVLAKVNVSQGASVLPTFFAGPVLAFNLSSKLVAEGESGGQSVSAEFDIKDETKSVDFGLVFGTGLGFPIGTGATNAGLEIRYTLGLTSIDDSGSDESIKNGVLSVMATFGFI